MDQYCASLKNKHVFCDKNQKVKYKVKTDEMKDFDKNKENI